MDPATQAAAEAAGAQAGTVHDHAVPNAGATWAVQLIFSSRDGLSSTIMLSPENARQIARALQNNALAAATKIVPATPKVKLS